MFSCPNGAHTKLIQLHWFAVSYRIHYKPDVRHPLGL